MTTFAMGLKASHHILIGGATHVKGDATIRF